MTTTSNDPQRLGELNATAQLGKFLSEYSEVAVILPVLAGLFVTSRLRLRGANALIVNLTIAAIARQLVNQLKQEAAVSLPETNGLVRGEVPSKSETPADEDYKIIHSVPGRIRLRVPKLQEDQLFAKRLEKLLLADPFVCGVRLNRSAASVVIQYIDGGLTELELGLRLLQALDQAQQPPTLNMLTPS
jgi:hypothetical protein